jgi:hypothetical protein
MFNLRRLADGLGQTGQAGKAAVPIREKHGQPGFGGL